MPDPTDLQRLLGWLDGYEDKTQPVEVPPQVLAEAHRTLREMAADFARINGLHNRHCDKRAGCVAVDVVTNRVCTCGLDAARNRWRLT